MIGAALANGMAANALDMDDGFSLLRGHPGSGFFGALISAAEYANATYGEVLAALVVAYEVSIRQGFSIRDYYKWDHSTGSYSTFAAAACVGKLLGLDTGELESALGIADFIAPLNPAKRSCYHPSMNKDGVYWGQHDGTQAVLMAQAGMTGKAPVILDDEYAGYIESLGEKYYFFDLYIKFYSCCRWAHSSIGAVSDLMEAHKLSSEDIEKIDIYSFGFSGTLYKEAPLTEDEAQYNIKYPIAAQVLFGDCGPMESSTQKMRDPMVKAVVDRISFHHEDEYDKYFPARRLSRAEITLKSGEKLISKAYEPKGDVNSEISIEDIREKVRELNLLYATEEHVQDFIDAVINCDPSEKFSVVYDTMKVLAAENLHPEIAFI